MSMMHGRDTMMIELIDATDTEGGYELLGATRTRCTRSAGGRTGARSTRSPAATTPCAGACTRRSTAGSPCATSSTRAARSTARSPSASGSAAGKHRPTFRQRARGTVRRMSGSLPRMLGADIEVACLDGRMQRYVNLDYAASTPVMADVWAAVEAFVPWYSSVHRGSGVKSQVATAAYEGARDAVGALRRRPRRATASSSCATRPRRSTCWRLRCPTGTRVLSTPVEHHANMLPWRRHDVRLLPFTRSPDELLDACESALRARRDRPARRHRRVERDGRGVAGRRAGRARPPLRRRAVRRRRAARAAPGRSTWPRRASTTSRSRATSSTRRSAPARWSAAVPEGEPLLAGGGAVELVTLDDVIWNGAPERYEAGSPERDRRRRAGRGVPAR